MTPAAIIGLVVLALVAVSLLYVGWLAWRFMTRPPRWWQGD